MQWEKWYTRDLWHTWGSQWRWAQQTREAPTINSERCVSVTSLEHCVYSFSFFLSRATCRSSVKHVFTVYILLLLYSSRHAWGGGSNGRWQAKCHGGLAYSSHCASDGWPTHINYPATHLGENWVVLSNWWAHCTKIFSAQCATNVWWGWCGVPTTSYPTHHFAPQWVHLLTEVECVHEKRLKGLFQWCKYKLHLWNYVVIAMHIHSSEFGYTLQVYLPHYKMSWVFYRSCRCHSRWANCVIRYH